MLPEDIWLVLAVGVVLGVIGWPIYRFAVQRPGRKSDPLAEAHERLRVAKMEAEAARVNREAERVYDDLYKDALGEEGEPPSRKDAK